jgi:hypothetical protein
MEVVAERHHKQVQRHANQRHGGEGGNQRQSVRQDVKSYLINHDSYEKLTLGKKLKRYDIYLDEEKGRRDLKMCMPFTLIGYSKTCGIRGQQQC